MPFTRMGYQFELSTTLKDNRTYMFSSDIKDDTAEWMGTIAKVRIADLSPCKFTFGETKSKD